ncbi:alpha/beta fold hydrolase [Leucobacter sp. UCMA 4100]|uniref:alpha/beta fold hydrolase n=1 Tax=Leucobacter sp. UCMA 4100 TaxID=2810534 RepID=UPI0022EAB987|nr:alpha/beta fold hydrolase [Leucobacter sp. UCMA 4100]
MTSASSFSIHSTLIHETPSAAKRRVVFLHGLFGRGKNFTRIANALLPEAESLLVDLPNHGQSEWTADLSYEELADLIAGHIRETSGEHLPIDLVGHSMGGKVAMTLALRHPELVRRLVVIDISPTNAISGRGQFEHLLGSLATINLATLEKRTDAAAQLKPLIPDDGVRGFLLQNLRRGDEGFAWEPNLHLLRAKLPTIMSFPEVGDANYTGPVLWVGGSESHYISDSDEPTMRSLFPKTIRMTVRGAGHWVHAEKPEEVIAALRGFLLSE